MRWRVTDERPPTEPDPLQGWPGCCTACGGTGTDPDGACWDCRGTGHTHEGKCRG